MLPRGVQPRSAWPWALALACVLLGAALLTGTWFETPDDPEMNALAAGQFQASTPVGV